MINCYSVHVLTFFVCLWTDHRPLLQFVNCWLPEGRLVSRKRIYSLFYLKSRMHLFLSWKPINSFYFMAVCAVFHEERICLVEASIHFSWKPIYLVVYLKRIWNVVFMKTYLSTFEASMHVSFVKAYLLFRESLLIHLFSWNHHAYVSFVSGHLLTRCLKTVCNVVFIKNILIPSISWSQNV
jgi:hypothetical protein